jgi:endonuclease/exonuclease/phosphatase family metal-dependent hydrolase
MCVARRAMPPIALDDRGRASTTLSVLTYNVEGLPWPARRNRGPPLREIARQLAELRGRGAAPDVVLLQEAFSAEAAGIGAKAGYPNLVPGPSVRTRQPPTSREADPSLTDRRKRRRGEGLGRLLSSGLYVLSDYPVVAAERRPFRRRECAGYVCLANKGLMHVRILVPGAPAAVDVFNTHLNSRGSAGVPGARSLKAHRLQVNEVNCFIETRWDRRNGLLFGGDFNMQRIDHAISIQQRQSCRRRRGHRRSDRDTGTAEARSCLRQDDEGRGPCRRR